LARTFDCQERIPDITGAKRTLLRENKQPSSNFLYTESFF